MILSNNLADTVSIEFSFPSHKFFADDTRYLQKFTNCAIANIFSVTQNEDESYQFTILNGLRPATLTQLKNLYAARLLGFMSTSNFS